MNEIERKETRLDSELVTRNEIINILLNIDAGNKYLYNEETEEVVDKIMAIIKIKYQDKLIKIFNVLMEEEEK